jgi:exoribonuclease II
MFSVIGAQGLARGARVQVRLGDIDLMALDVKGTVTAHLDAPVATEGETEEVEDDETLNTGAVTIAVDLSDSTQSDGS